MGKLINNINHSKSGISKKDLKNASKTIIHKAKALTTLDVEANRSSAYTYLEL